MTRHLGAMRLFLAAFSIIAAGAAANAHDIRYVPRTGSNPYECTLPTPCFRLHPGAPREGHASHALANQGVLLKAAAADVAATGSTTYGSRLFGLPVNVAAARAAVDKVQFNSATEKGLFLATVAATAIRGLVALLQLFAALRRLTRASAPLGSRGDYR